jgi:hypothetical protein
MTKIIPMQTVVDTTATQCDGPDSINVNFEAFIWHIALFNWVYQFSYFDIIPRQTCLFGVKNNIFM